MIFKQKLAINFNLKRRFNAQIHKTPIHYFHITIVSFAETSKRSHKNKTKQSRTRQKKHKKQTEKANKSRRGEIHTVTSVSFFMAGADLCQRRSTRVLITIAMSEKPLCFSPPPAFPFIPRVDVCMYEDRDVSMRGKSMRALNRVLLFRELINNNSV